VTRGKYYIDKICTNMGGSKNAKKPNEKKKVLYQRTKVQKLGSPKIKGLKNLINYIKWKLETLNHIIIYNLVFNLVNNSCICSPSYMMSNVQMVVLHLNLNCIYNKLFLCYVLNPINTQKPPN
jgi:hypothetical protein